MLLFGHPFVKSEIFYHIFDSEAVVSTPPNSTMYLEFSKKNLDIVEFLRINEIPFALEVSTIHDLVVAENLGAKYICVERSFAKTAQDIAENYLFDAKILAHIGEEEDLEGLALLGIDGVVYPSAVVKISK